MAGRENENNLKKTTNWYKKEKREKKLRKEEKKEIIGAWKKLMKEIWKIKKRIEAVVFIQF